MDRVQRVQGLRSSGAAGPHKGGSRRDLVRDEIEQGISEYEEDR